MPDTADEDASTPAPGSEVPSGDDPAAAGSSRGGKQRSFLRELPVLLLVALLLSFVIQTFIARVYVIPSGSMEPTLHGCLGCENDRIVVDKVVYRFSEPRPGDVVVFRGPPSWEAEFTSARSDNVVVRGLQQVGAVVGLAPPDERDFVKRVIATGGQTVECCDDQGRVLVDGQPLDEPYVVEDFPFLPGEQDCASPSPSGRCFAPVTVPEGNVWVMGDARNNSADSRVHVGDELRGTIPLDNVIGKTRVVVLPVSRWQTVDSPEILASAAGSGAEPSGPPTAPLLLGVLGVWPLVGLARGGDLVGLARTAEQTGTTAPERRR